MHTDSFYLIGKSHAVCQDYSFSKTFKTRDGLDAAVAIVSDGCSSSPDSDMGSRLLTRYLADELESVLKFNVVGRTYTSSDFEQHFIRAIRQASAPAAAMGLDKMALDATLLAIILVGNELYTCMWGDGCYAWGNGNEVYGVVKVEYSAGYPDYLNYVLNADRQAAFMQIENSRVITRCDNRDKSTEVNVHPLACDHIFMEEFDVMKSSDYWVAIMSDGACSFLKGYDSPENCSTEPNTVISEMLSFKNFGGKFVSRRLNAFEKSCAKNNIWHDDDLSVAAVYLGE